MDLKKHINIMNYFIAGSDLLSAITATFEEKMRSLQESPLGLAASDGNDSSSSSSSQDSSPEEPPHLPEQLARGSSGCRLYRDPSLHRRRTSPRTSVTSPPTVPVAAATTTTATTTPSHISQVCWMFSSSCKNICLAWITIHFNVSNYSSLNHILHYKGTAPFMLPDSYPVHSEIYSLLSSHNLLVVLSLLIYFQCLAGWRQSIK